MISFFLCMTYFTQFIEVSRFIHVAAMSPEVPWSICILTIGTAGDAENSRRIGGKEEKGRLRLPIFSFVTLLR